MAAVMKYALGGATSIAVGGPSDWGSGCDEWKSLGYLFATAEKVNCLKSRGAGDLHVIEHLEATGPFEHFRTLRRFMRLILLLFLFKGIRPPAAGPRSRAQQFFFLL